MIFKSTLRRPSGYIYKLVRLHPARGEVEDLHPLVLSAKANSEDNPRYHEAMNGPDSGSSWELCKSSMINYKKEGLDYC